MALASWCCFLQISIIIQTKDKYILKRMQIEPDLFQEVDYF